jgi:hypothetical protein
VGFSNTGWRHQQLAYAAEWPAVKGQKAIPNWRSSKPQPFGRTSVSQFGHDRASADCPSSFPALPSRFKSFQIAVRAVDNLRGPAGTIEATER